MYLLILLFHVNTKKRKVTYQSKSKLTLSLKMVKNALKILECERPQNVKVCFAIFQHYA